MNWQNATLLLKKNRMLIMALSCIITCALIFWVVTLLVATFYFTNPVFCMIPPKAKLTQIKKTHY